MTNKSKSLLWLLGQSNLTFHVIVHIIFLLFKNRISEFPTLFFFEFPTLIYKYFILIGIIISYYHSFIINNPQSKFCRHEDITQWFPNYEIIITYFCNIMSVKKNNFVTICDLSHVHYLNMYNFRYKMLKLNLFPGVRYKF